MVDLGTLGGSSSRAAGHRTTAARSSARATCAATPRTHAFVWTQAGGMVDLGTLGGSYSFAAGINARGHVAGGSSTTGDAEFHATLWKPRGR